MVYLTLSENGHHSELKKTEPMISDPEQCGHRGRRMNAFVVNYEEKLGPSGVGDTGDSGCIHGFGTSWWLCGSLWRKDTRQIFVTLLHSSWSLWSQGWLAGASVCLSACVPMSTFSAPVRAAWVSWPHSPHHDPLMVSNNVIRDAFKKKNFIFSDIESIAFYPPTH